MPETAPSRIVRQHRCDLGEREHEHEIEEELERRYALLTFSVQLTHRPTLTRTDRDRTLTTSGWELSGVCELTAVRKLMREAAPRTTTHSSPPPRFATLNSKAQDPSDKQPVVPRLPVEGGRLDAK